MHGPNNTEPGHAEPIKLMCLNHGNHVVKLHGAFNARNELVTVEASGLPPEKWSSLKYGF